jgi:hypothetical protein
MTVTNLNNANPELDLATLILEKCKRGVHWNLADYAELVRDIGQMAGQASGLDPDPISKEGLAIGSGLIGAAAAAMAAHAGAKVAPRAFGIAIAPKPAVAAAPAAAQPAK